jgi:hypothetical protein
MQIELDQNHSYQLKQVTSVVLLLCFLQQTVCSVQSPLQ